MQQENTPAKVGLLELLRSAYGVQFVIPAYQRNYTWSANREVKQLLEDIKAVLRGERNKHFIGIIIYLERSLDFSKRERSVIDGQQRLTTLFLLLYAIKELMIENGLIDEANQLDVHYLTNPHDQTLKYRLKPLVNDDTVYQKIVNREFEKITEKKSNIWLNYDYLKNELKSLSKEYSFDQMFKEINKLYLVCVPISIEDYPQQIFESINATGAKLTASDLIRNFILMPIESEKQETYYIKYWKELERLISPDSKKLEAFFRFFLIAKKKAIVKKSDVYRMFTVWFNEIQPNKDIENVFKEVLEYADHHYSIYSKPIQDLHECLKKPLEEFRFILSDMPASLLMELFHLNKQKDSEGHPLISEKQLGEIITVLNSYLMRRSLCDFDTSPISNYFPTLLKETISDCDGDFTNIVSIFKKNLINRNKGMSMEMPDDRKVFERILNANMYNIRNSLFIFLRKLESENNPAPVDFSKLSIEHLMPQKARPEWLDMLQTDRETYEQNLHRLGNLTFAARSDNSKMSNRLWEYKSKILSSTGHLRINQKLLEKKEWTLADIENRTKILINEIIRLYPYYEAKGEEITKIPVSIDSYEGAAKGIFFPDNGSIEVFASSVVNTSYPTADKYLWIEEDRNKLIEDGVLAWNENNELIFTQNHTFYAQRKSDTALSSAASFILHGARNGWEYWIDEEGTPLGEIPNLRK